jgi:hypothetical protein
MPWIPGLKLLLIWREARAWLLCLVDFDAFVAAIVRSLSEANKYEYVKFTQSSLGNPVLISYFKEAPLLFSKNTQHSPDHKRRTGVILLLQYFAMNKVSQVAIWAWFSFWALLWRMFKLFHILLARPTISRTANERCVLSVSYLN